MTAQCPLRVTSGHESADLGCPLYPPKQNFAGAVGTDSAGIIDVSKLKGDQVMFGATVTLLDEDTEEKVKYRIVGELEADVKQGRISITSPIARALLGKRKRDIIEVSTPGGGKSYELLKVEYK